MHRDIPDKLRSQANLDCSKRKTGGEKRKLPQNLTLEEAEQATTNGEKKSVQTREVVFSSQECAAVQHPSRDALSDALVQRFKVRRLLRR